MKLHFPTWTIGCIILPFCLFSCKNKKPVPVETNIELDDDTPMPNELKDDLPETPSEPIEYIHKSDHWPINPPVIHQNVEYTSLQEAIDAAGNNDSIQLEEGVYFQNFVITDKQNFKIYAPNGPAVFIMAKPLKSLAKITNSNHIKLENLSFKFSNTSEVDIATKDNLRAIYIANSSNIHLHKIGTGYKIYTPIEAHQTKQITISNSLLTGYSPMLKLTNCKQLTLHQNAISYYEWYEHSNDGQKIKANDSWYKNNKFLDKNVFVTDSLEAYLGSYFLTMDFLGQSTEGILKAGPQLQLDHSTAIDIERHQQENSIWKELLFSGIYYRSEAYFNIYKDRSSIGVNHTTSARFVLQFNSVGESEFIDGMHEEFELCNADSSMFFIIDTANTSTEDIKYAHILKEESYYTIEFMGKTEKYFIQNTDIESSLMKVENDQPSIVAYKRGHLMGENDIYYGIQDIFWAGDLNGDGELDLILTLTGYCDPSYILLLSNKGSLDAYYYPDQKYMPCGC